MPGPRHPLAESFLVLAVPDVHAVRMNSVNGGWATWGWGERTGMIVLAASVVLLVWAAFQYGGGHEVAFFALVAAFAAGITGLGVHTAAREARFRREARPRE